MICPVCKISMIVVERNNIELDHCTNCGGIWFDAGELELLLASLGVTQPESFLKDLLNSPGEKTRESVRRCPVCRGNMKKVFIGEKPHLLIDVCPRGEGLWFDGGELNALLKQVAAQPLVGPDAARKISEFLGDVFQSTQVENKG